MEFYGGPKEDVTVNFHCDSTSVLRRAEAVISGRGLKTYTAAEYDIVAEIQGAVAAMKEYGVVIGSVWV